MARLADTTNGGFGTVSDLAATSDGAFVGFPSGASTFWVLDTASWSVAQVAACDGTSGAAARVDENGNHWFYTGCSDGTVVPISVTSAGSPSKETVTFTVGESAVKAVEADDSYVYAVFGSDVTWQATALGASDGVVKTGYPVTLNLTSLKDTILFPTLLVGLDGSANFVKVDLSTNTPSTTAGDLSFYKWVEGWNYNDTDLYLADSTGRFGYVNPSNNVFQSQVTVEPDVQAVGITTDGQYIFAGSSEDTQVYGFADLSKKTTLSGTGGVKEFAAIDGYMLGVNDAGEVLVYSERPWVEVTSVSSSSAVEGSKLSLSFTSDTEGSWEFRVGGDASGSGTLIDSGSIQAGASQSVDVTVDDRFAEGTNRLWIFVDAGNGLIGHDAGSVVVNNPPGIIDLSLSFGEEKVTAQFDTLPDEDLKEYDFYISTVPFSAADWPTGGPEYEGPDKGLDISPTPAGNGERVTRTFYPLTNDTTYYVAVRAIDATNLEGPMSEVKSATPLPTYGAAQLAGEKGGFCGTEGRPGMALLAMGALAVGLRRRQWGLLMVLMALLPTVAQAREKESPKVSTISLRYGPVTLDDPHMEEVYGTSDQELVRLEYGVTSDFLEGTLGLGFFQELGSQVTADGTSSDEHVMMTIWPLNVDVVGKLDLLREQPLVPFARVGLDAWMWDENWGSRLPGAVVPYDHLGGGKFGWHYGFGGMILLDSLDRTTADRVEANTGINDTYIVGEFRNTTMFKSDGLKFDSTEISFGLRLDI